MLSGFSGVAAADRPDVPDVKMPGLKGTRTLLRSLKESAKGRFYCCHQDYAVEGFDLNAMSIICSNPFLSERFLRAMDKVFTGLNITN